MMAEKTYPWQLSFWSHTWRACNANTKRVFFGLLLLHFVLTFLFQWQQGALFDESDYYAYAHQWAKGNPMRTSPIMDSKTPMMAVSLLPAIIKPLLPASLLENDVFFYLKLGRPFMYVFQALGLFTMFCWLRNRNQQKWFWPLLLYAFDPLIFSYGMFVASDLASASILVALMYAAMRFTETKSSRYFLALSVLSALAVVTKASMIYCYPLLIVLFLFQRKTLAFRFSALVKGVFVFAAVQWLVINLAWYFNGTFTPWGDYHFESASLQHLQSSLSFAGSLPLLLPTPFIQGIDMLKHHAEIGGCLPESTYRGVWLFGKVWCNETVWYYYLATALFKMPLFILMLPGIAILSFFRANNKQQRIQSSLFIWLPLLYFLCILSLANKFQIGIRHAILLLPFLYLLLSDTVEKLREQRRKLFMALFALHSISLLVYWPNMLSYTNELLWNKTTAYHIIRDSSIDYGQGRPWIKHFIATHPEYKQPTNIPDTGKFIIGIGDLYAEHEGEKKNIAWLRNHFSPDGNYRYSLLLFTVTEKDIADKHLK